VVTGFHASFGHGTVTSSREERPAPASLSVTRSTFA
jgi:hypothetical protein